MARVSSRAVACLLAFAVPTAAGVGCGPRSGGEPRAAPPATAERPAPPPPPPPPVRRPTRPLLIATLGDSITAGAPLWDPDPAYRRQLGDGVSVRSQYQYWARRRLGPRATFRNCGVSGETSDQIAVRLDACAAGAQVLIVQGGVNDIARGGEVGETAANLREIVRRGRQRGLRVAIAEILPWNNGYPDAAPAIDALNRLIAAIAREEGARLLRWHRAIEDPAARGRMRPDWTIEGDHPSVTGYRRLGEAVVLP